MRQQLVDDLLAFLKASPVSEERDRLIEEFQAIRADLVYKPQTSYRLERRYTSRKAEYVDGKFEMVPYPTMMNIARTPHHLKMKRLMAEALETYPLEELRLYHGSRRIKDILGWLDEN